MNIPVFRVTTKGAAVRMVEWDPRKDGEALFDLTDWKVLSLERIVEVDALPTVKVTFVARLAEVEEEDA